MLFLTSWLSRAFPIVLITAFFVLTASAVPATEIMLGEAAAKILAERIGTFRARGAAVPIEQLGDNDVATIGIDGVGSAARSYVSQNGEPYIVKIYTTASEAAAYALFTSARTSLNTSGTTNGEASLGLASLVSPNRALLAKGKIFVTIQPSGTRAKSLVDLARSVSDNLERGESEVPVLVKHLPDWENAQRRASYFVNSEALTQAFDSPILDAISFEGGSEAASADYGNQKLLVVEFTTPQLATENDQHLLKRLEELKAAGQPLPSTYRRVGNYGVFLFNAESEQAANDLINQIKYEQVTQWLGDNPYPLLEAQRRYTATTLGVLVSVVKASGLALLTCLTAGGLFGGLLFLRRRSQQRALEAYSDAGGMLRLNLDEMTPQTDPARLIRGGR